MHSTIPNNFSPQKAFTLIELLVVIAIIGLLASIVMVATQSARAKGRDAKRIENLKQFQSAIEIYYVQHGEYPGMGEVTYYYNTGGNWCIGWPPGIAGCDQSSPYIAKFLADMAPLMSSLPKGTPSGKVTYVATDNSCQTASGVSLSFWYVRFDSHRYKASTRLETDCERVRNDGGVSTCCAILPSSKGRSYESYEVFNDPTMANQNPG